MDNVFFVILESQSIRFASGGTISFQRGEVLTGDEITNRALAAGATEEEITAMATNMGASAVRLTIETDADGIYFRPNTILGTLYNYYVITYNVGDGSGEIAPVEVIAGQPIILNDGAGITPPEGKVFAGWATTADATEPQYDGGDGYLPRGDITLYAVYTDAE